MLSWLKSLFSTTKPQEKQVYPVSDSIVPARSILKSRSLSEGPTLLSSLSKAPHGQHVSFVTDSIEKVGEMPLLKEEESQVAFTIGDSKEQLRFSRSNSLLHLSPKDSLEKLIPRPSTSPGQGNSNIKLKIGLEVLDKGHNLKHSIQKSFSDVKKIFSEAFKGSKDENLHHQSSKAEPVSVYICTWNMNGMLPDVDIAPLFEKAKQQPTHPHLIVVGSQECQQSIEKSLVFPSKEEWERTLKKLVGSEYLMMRAETLMAMHMAVFVRKNITQMVQDIDSARIATGIGNMIGNKGGMGIALKFPEFSILLVNSHLTPHQDKVGDRNLDYSRINKELELNGFDQADSERETLTEKYDYTFWFGDLNYRINGSRENVEKLVQDLNFDLLKTSDQLRGEMLKGTAFTGFWEAPINFHPTFKFDTIRNYSEKPGSARSNRSSDSNELNRSNASFLMRSLSKSNRKVYPTLTMMGQYQTTGYDSSVKNRIPSWTDRILFTSRLNPSFINQSHYFSEPWLLQESLAELEKFIQPLSDDQIKKWIEFYNSIHDTSKRLAIFAGPQPTKMINSLHYDSLMEINCSDHKPVVGLYQLKHRFVFPKYQDYCELPPQESPFLKKKRSTKRKRQAFSDKLKSMCTIQ